MSYKVCLDAGHGGKDSGAVGRYGEREKIIALQAVQEIGVILGNQDINVVFTRTVDDFIELSDRAKIANNEKVDLFISVHLNSADKIASGFETFHYPDSESGQAFADKVHSKIRNLNIFKDRGVKSANFAVLRETEMPAILVELCFINNPDDVAILYDNFLNICYAVSTGIMDQLSLPDDSEKNANITNICGSSEAMAWQMANYLLSKNPNPDLPYCSAYELADIFIIEGEKEGIRGDIAWCQSLKETGYFKYGGIVNPEQNNYAGIGALNNNENGNCAAFVSPYIGARAQIQHLKAYANTQPLQLECVDPRFNLVKRGSAPYVEWLGKADNPNGAGWAVPGDGYGASILKILSEVLKVKGTPKSTPPETMYPEWLSAGYKLSIEKGICKTPEYWEKDGKLDRPPTAMEMFAVLAYMPK